MARKSHTIGIILILVLAGAGGIVTAGANGPVAQTGETPAETPEAQTPGEPTVTPAESSPTPETEASEAATPAEPDESAGTAVDDAPEPSDGNTTISVSASASASAAPDTARIQAAVVATASDAQTARQQAAENVSATREALRESGITDDQFQTTQFDIRTVREPRENRTQQTRYQAVNQFQIEVSPDQAGEIIDVAVGNGTNQINGVTFTLAEDTRRDLRQEALRDAMANARTDANTLAEESNVSVSSVRSVSTADVTFMPFESQYAGGVAEDASTVIEPGPVEVTATVSVTYRAK